MKRLLQFIVIARIVFGVESICAADTSLPSERASDTCGSFYISVGDGDIRNHARDRFEIRVLRKHNVDRAGRCGCVG